MRRIFLDSGEVIVVGDSLQKDMKGAKNAGIKSIWFIPEGIENSTVIMPDHEISSLLQLREILQLLVGDCRAQKKDIMLQISF